MKLPCQRIMNIAQDLVVHEEQLKDFFTYDGVKEDKHDDDNKEEESLLYQLALFLSHQQCRSILIVLLELDCS